MSSDKRQVTANEWTSTRAQECPSFTSANPLILHFFCGLRHWLRCPVTACSNDYQHLSDDFNTSCPRRTAGDCLVGHWPPTRCCSFSRPGRCISIHPRSSSTLSWTPEGSGCVNFKRVQCVQMRKTHPVSKNPRCVASLWPTFSHDWRLEFPFLKKLKTAKPVFEYLCYIAHISLLSASSHHLLHASPCTWRWPRSVPHPAPKARRGFPPPHPGAGIDLRPAVGVLSCWSGVSLWEHNLLSMRWNLKSNVQISCALWLCVVAPSHFQNGSITSTIEGGSAPQCNVPHPDSKERHTLQNHVFSLRLFCFLFYTSLPP